jgi:CRISPR type III-B/RAMP module RAMP protein Cmr6
VTAPKTVIRAAGPLGTVVETDGTRLHGRGTYALGVGANPLVLLHRVAFVTAGGQFDSDAERALLSWAQETRLGQDPHLVRLAAERRERAIVAARRSSTHRRLLVRPQWRVAVGLGNRLNPYEIGLSMHGTYGWPVLPGSTIKGLTCAWARESGAAKQDAATFTAVFGLPRVFDTDGAAADEEAANHRGSVTFLDALPVGDAVAVVRDVVTPHVQPYYGKDPQPPAEYHNPVPAEFLVVSAGTFAVDLLGPPGHVHQAAGWCATAIDELGVGAKTAAGYGYLTVLDTA